MARRPEPAHFRLTRLAPGVHAAIATVDGYGLCNAGIVDLGGESVVFDSMLTPMAGRALARAAERLTGRTPGWVVNSHWHGDHVWGNPSFVAAHIVSTRRVREVVIERSRRQFDTDRRAIPAELRRLDAPDGPYDRRDARQLRAWFRGVLTAPRSLRTVPPDVTFTDELVLEGSRRSLHLVSYGGGHSPSDVFGYLPDERIVFAGDLALVGYHLSVGDGWPVPWRRILARMRRLRVDTVLPGHGALGTARSLDDSFRYLGDIASLATSARRRGTALRDLVRTPVPERYARWRFSFMFGENLARSYRLLRPRRARPSAGGSGPSGPGAL